MLEKWQAKLVQMLKDFHAFCVKHNLCYYVIGGTCLGAVRHQNIIPWDDDVDVGMPRQDYQRLLEIVKTEPIGENYIVEAPLEKEDNDYLWAKMYNKTTTLIELTKKKIKRGVFIDIFPLDGAGDDFKKAERHVHKITRVRNVFRVKISMVLPRRKFYKNLFIILFRWLPINTKKLIKKIINMSQQWGFDSSEYVANFVGAWGVREISRKEWFGEPKLYDFAGAKVYGPSNADAYLTAVYGDYMQLPPEEKRVSHHDFVALDLEKGFLDE